METKTTGTSKETLNTIVNLMRVFPKDRAHLKASERLDLITIASTMASQAKVLLATLIAEADTENASMRANGTPTGTYLATQTHVSAKQANSTVFEAQRLEKLPVSRDAVLEGAISYDHARAVSKAMASMPPSFTPEQHGQAETLLVSMAKRTTPDNIVKAAARVAEQVDPQDSDEREATRLTREREMALRNRSLTFWKERGSVGFKGSLPLVEGEKLITLIDAYATQARRNQQDALDPETDQTTPVQRRADALVQLVENTNRHQDGPTLAGDRPTIVVTLDYHKLLTQAGAAGILPDGNPLSAGDLRRLCCDSHLIPAILGSASEPLDVGRTQRFVTTTIRKALTLRDKHCAFPNCYTPATHCDAHHITPWWEGGLTSLNNLVLLCPHHHGLIEPDKYASRDQWKVIIDTDGYPTFIPPGRFPDPTPTRHTNAPPLTTDPTMPTANPLTKKSGVDCGVT